MLSFTNAQNKVFTTYLWHLQQPIYWPEKSQQNTNRYQYVKESHDIKMSGGNNYGTGISHPLNDLQEIFSKDDRKNIYQHGAKDAVQQLLGYSDAGAQVSYSGVLIENVNSLANANQWGYYTNWQNNYVTARGWQTSGGKPRLDLVGFTHHHVISPLVSERALRKDIQAHKYIYGQTFGTNPLYSKGYWPAECAFSERIIKVLAEEGFEWSIIANSHLARTLNDYPLHYGTNGCNVSPPNKADKVATNGTNWWNGQIDGRGGEFAAPYCYQAHKAKYVDPATGVEYKITVVPMADLLSYRDGYSQMGTDDITSKILPYSNTSQPSLVLLAHDGDNAWGGGSSYYFESVPSFVSQVHNHSQMHPTTIQQFLTDNPVPQNDIVKVEDGSWFNAEGDWGHPQYINWLWPLYNNQTKEFNPNGWTEDARNWAVITAIDNYACMAEDLEGNLDIADIVYPTSSSSNAEKAWHFYLPATASCYMYYGKSLDMEVKQTIAGNNAIGFAQQVINAHQGVDNTSPSVFIPQRFPYNPGGKEFGPIYGYQEFTSPSDFYVWTFVYDVSGLQSVVLKYRTDKDGSNPLTDNDNDTYAGGSGVNEWHSINMSMRVMETGNVTNDPEIDFFVLPTAIANLYYAQITGLKDTLVDYYVEATDNKGNTFKSPIQHVYVGSATSSNTNSYLYWLPTNPTKNDVITIVDSQATSQSKLHWGVTVDGQNWIAPISQYWPQGTVSFDQQAVQTPFTDPDNDGVYTVEIGPLNNPSQVVEKVCFVVKLNDNSWDNNGGADYFIPIINAVNDNPTSANKTISIVQNTTYTFSSNDFQFNGVGGATFAGIRVVNTVIKGSLKYNNVDVTNEQVCPDVTKLTFTPFEGQTGMPYTYFIFKVIDSEGRESDNSYTFTINVTSVNPLSGNASITILQNQTYNFENSNFPFNSPIGASFEAVKIETLPNKGVLKYNNTNVTQGQEITNIALLSYTPANNESGFPYTSFNFRVKDNNGNYSQYQYTLTINVVANVPNGVSWSPQNPTSNDVVTIYVSNDPSMNSGSKLHWGVINWNKPNEAYWPSGSTLWSDNTAVETPFSYQNGIYFINLGPFNNSAQQVSKIDFVIHYGGDSWNNNGGADWHINVTQAVDNNEKIKNSAVIFPNPMTDFAVIDLTEFEGNFNITIFSAKGQNMQSIDVFAPYKLLISKGNLTAGIYHIRFINKDKNQVFYKTLVVE